MAQRALPVWESVTPDLMMPQNDDGSDHPTWFRPIASLILPGTGQLMAGQDRGAIYLAVEGLLLIRFFSFQSEGRRQGDQYRDLAFTIARAPFDPVLRDTTFSYFEKMGKYVESGPFDTDEGPGLAPPEDTQSYNGNQWALAKQTFFLSSCNVAGVEETVFLEKEYAINFADFRLDEAAHGIGQSVAPPHRLHDHVSRHMGNL